MSALDGICDAVGSMFATLMIFSVAPAALRSEFRISATAIAGVVAIATLTEDVTAAGLVGHSTLADLTIETFPTDIDAAKGTIVGRISGKNPRSTLSIAATQYFTISGNNILKGANSYSLAGEYKVVVTETLNGSPNSPKTTNATVKVMRDTTPTLGLPWSPDYFPELFVNLWVQEDLPDGPVAAHPARGFLGHSATEASPTLRPTKIPDEGGVQFAENGGQVLEIPNINDALRTVRNVLMVYRIDGQSGSNNEAILLAVNDIQTSGGKVPRLSFTKPDTSFILWNGQAGDTATWVVNSTGVVADGNTWNIVSTIRRDGRIYATLNGGDLVENPSNPDVPFTGATQFAIGRIGAVTADNPEWAYDLIAELQTELSDAILRKLEGWAAHRRGIQSRLPVGHPYRTKHPVIDADDFPDNYVHDRVAWAAFGVSAEDDPDRFANRGGTPPAEPSTIVVFRDDFRADTVVRSNNVPAHHSVWFAPGSNTAIGINAVLNYPTDTPDCYVHHPVGQTMTQRLQYDSAQSRWETGTFMSIDNAGTGRAWGGEKIIEARFKLLQPVIGGLFHGPIWSYGLEHMFNRIGERIEVDYLELDGGGPSWLNSMASHVHSGQFRGRIRHLAADAEAYKVCGFTLNDGNVGFDHNHWDNAFHTWTFRILSDYTYVILDNIEMARVPTPAEYLRRLYLVSSMGYRASLGAGTPGTHYDMVIDYIAVRQPTAQVQSFAAPFTARPTLSGTAQVGEVITCDPKLPAELAATADFWWYRSGYPIVGQVSGTYTLTAADMGSKIRCMVKAVGATDQPEAWTDETATVVG